MEALFTKIFELLEKWIEVLLPWIILPDDFCGLIRRLGKYHRDVSHGWNWKWPVIERPETVCSALDTAVLREQSLTTKDEVTITVRGVLTYRVVDPRKYILDCGNAVEVVNDVVCCVIADLIPRLTAREVLHEDAFTRELLRKVRYRGKRWGIEVDACGLVDRVAARTYRIISNGGRTGLPE